MSSIQALTWNETEPGCREATAGGTWFTRAVLFAADGPLRARTTDEEESGLLVLSGTVDLEAGAGSWISRGTRATPLDGMPVALFLPPKTPYGSAGGQGEILVVSARRPELPKPVEEEKPAKKPLLPLAGSGKAYDSASGSWQPLESFPDSPEAILPRRIARRELDGVHVREVFDPTYKTRGLCLSEAVLEDGAALALPSLGAPALDGYPDEWLLYARVEGELICRSESGETAVVDGAALLGSGAAELRATGGRAYVAFACSGPKPTT